MKLFLGAGLTLVAARAVGGAGPQVEGHGDAWTSTPAKVAAQPRVEAKDAQPVQGTRSIEPADSKPEKPSVAETDGWEAQFAWGLYHSKRACLASESGAGPWALDRLNSRAGVPQEMLRAEELLASVRAPAEQQRQKLAERALRLYYHAKWLAERNHATAAEWRYREASRLALQTRRKVLAAHALGRFGYFLIHWNRRQEAKEVLQESIRISSKSNPLAPYLLGVLERQDAGSDLARLEAAEEMILNGGEQPSEDLEAERQKMVQVIFFWRQAVSSPRHCFASPDLAFVAICLFGHLFQR